MTAPQFCSSLPQSSSLCSQAALSVVASSGQFVFSVPSPSTACPGNYSAVELCLNAGGSLAACRPSCSVAYGYLLTETAGPGLSSAAQLSFTVVPPVAHVTVSVVSLQGPGPFVLGDNVTFALRVFNAGPERASAVRVLVGVASGLQSQPLQQQWLIPSLNVGQTSELLLPTVAQNVSLPLVVTALIANLTEFDYSVAGHFALARVLAVPPAAPIAPNQTFAVTNASCASLNVLG